MTTIHEWLDHLRSTYRHRNDVFNPNFDRRLLQLARAVGNVQDAIRRPANRPVGAALASVFGWTACVIDHFYKLPILPAIRFKWAGKVCSYCGQLPCVCTVARSTNSNDEDVLIVKLLNQNSIWGAEDNLSLDDLQSNIHKRYHEVNSRGGGGLMGCVDRLYREVCDVAQINLDNHWGSNDEALKIKAYYALELSDVIAWTLAAADQVPCNLCDELENRYGRDKITAERI